MLSIGSQSFISKALILALLIGLMTSSYMVPQASAATMTFNVNSTLDLPDAEINGLCAEGVESKCTLRAAIMEANANPGADIIVLPAGTYQLSIAGSGENAAATGDLDITDHLTVIGSSGDMNGNAANTVIDGGDMERIFSVNPNDDKVIQATFQALTIQNGHYAEVGQEIGGGAIDFEASDGVTENGGSLNIYNCIFTNNQVTGSNAGGGAILLSSSNPIAATATIEKTRIYDNTTADGHGGGIYNTGMELIIRDSWISNNRADSTAGAYGGGIYTVNGGTTRIERTTISGNTAAGSSSSGGGIYSGHALEINNSTITGNSSTGVGGGIWADAAVSIRNATIAFNDAQDGGGMYLTNASATTLNNSIVYSNTSNSLNDIYGNVTLMTSYHNLVGSSGTGGIMHAVNGNRVGVDPLLGSLSNTGGFAPTHKLLAGSPAIDAGNNIYAAGSPDQRGNPRRVDGADSDMIDTVDIGAVEAFPTLSDIGDQSGIAGDSLEIPFYAGDYTYGYDITAVSDNETVVPNGNLVITNQNSHQPTLTVTGAAAGSATITVTVNAGADTATDTFVVNVTAPVLSSNADLSHLTLSEGTLSPAFAAGTTAYTVSVGHAVTSIDVTPTIEDVAATLTVNGTAAATGQASSVSLVVGTNVIPIIVTAQDGTTKTYIITVTRAQSSNADLSQLILSQGTLTPSFTPDITSYSVNVANSVSSLQLTATALHSGATLTLNGTMAASGNATSIPLTVGSNQVTIVVTAEDGATTKSYQLTVVRENSNTSNDHVIISPPPPEVTPPPVIEPPKEEDSGKEPEIIETPQPVERGVAVLTEAEMDRQLKQQEHEPVVIISIEDEVEQSVAVIGGDLVSELVDKRASIEVQSPLGSYLLPADELNLEELLTQFGSQAELSDVRLNIAISQGDEAASDALMKSAEEGQFEVLLPPVDYKVTLSFNDQIVEVEGYDTFVQSKIVIPSDIDPKDITTAVALQEDGSVRHVPTFVTVEGDQPVAVVNSLSNETYTLISNEESFADTQNHWANEAIQDLASRLVIEGFGDGGFGPGAGVTRAQFATVLARALGLSIPDVNTNLQSSFTDVQGSEWHIGAIAAAEKAGLITGFEDGTFRPELTVSREQAMIMLSRAAELTGMSGSISDQEVSETLTSFADQDQISPWAEHAIALLKKNNILQGTDQGLLPDKEMTRAEMAQVIQRLLKNTQLIQ